jgi:Ser/Thr protein kinase RdoA (MazF antagonist)
VGERDRTLTLSDDLLARLERSFGLRLQDAVRLRTVIGVRTNGGAMILKRYKGEGMKRRIDAIGEAVDALVDAGLEVAPYLKTRQDSYAATDGGDLWTIQPWLPGRHLALTSAEEREAAARALARMHAVPVGRQIDKAFFLRVPPLWEKYRYRLDRAQEATLRATSLHDLWRPYAERARHTVRELQEITMRAWDRDRRHGCFCHRDPAPHNFLWQGEGAAIIDFDLAGMDVRAHDLYQLINHAVYLNGWEPGLIDGMIHAYDRELPLGTDNWQVLKALMRYPALVIREWYDFGKSQDRAVFLPRLQWAALQEDRRERDRRKP